MFCIGEVSEEAKRLVEVTKESVDLALKDTAMGNGIFMHKRIDFFRRHTRADIFPHHIQNFRIGS